jgi:hypothetical protein
MVDFFFNHSTSAAQFGRLLSVKSWLVIIAIAGCFGFELSPGCIYGLLRLHKMISINRGRPAYKICQRFPTGDLMERVYNSRRIEAVPGKDSDPPYSHYGYFPWNWGTLFASF